MADDSKPAFPRPPHLVATDSFGNTEWRGGAPGMTLPALARGAVRTADALLAALAEGK